MADLYMVIRIHCAEGPLGNVVAVTEIEPPHPNFYLRCTSCKQVFAYNEPHALIAGEMRYHPLSWLKKMPPPEEVKEVEEAECIGTVKESVI